jgi:hypothetical protein
MFSLVVLSLLEIGRHICEVAMLRWVARSPQVVRVDDTRAALYGRACHVLGRSRGHRVVAEGTLAILWRDKIRRSSRGWLRRLYWR